MLVTWYDLRIAARRLARVPGFTGSAVLLLAVAIAGTTFVFSAVRSLLLQKVPYANADRLVVLLPVAPRSELVDELAAQRGIFSSLGAYAQRAANLAGGGSSAERVLTVRVTPAFLDITGTRPLAGRLFVASDFTGPGERVALITERVWRQRYGGEQSVVGRSLILDGRDHRIVGVLSSTFQTVEQMQRAHELPFARDVAVVLPLSGNAEAYDPSSTDKVWRGLTIVARLRDGVSPAQAYQSLSPLLARAQMHYRLWEPFTLAPLAAVTVGTLGSQLRIVSLAVLILLLVGCANVTNLVFTRVEGRRRELAVCAAIGSSARRIISGVLAETLLIAGLGGALGVLLTWQAMAATRAMTAGMLELETMRIDLPLLGFALAITCLTGVIVGLSPALRYAKGDPSALVMVPTGEARTLGGVPLSSCLVVTQVALAVVLVVVGALLTRAFVRSSFVTLGFETKGILTAEMSLDRSAYWRYAATDYFTKVLERTAALPGVDRIALVSTLPGGQFDAGTGVKIGGTLFFTDTAIVSANYFSLLSIPLLAGGTFTENDTRRSTPVVVVNEAFARTHWGKPGDAVGRTIAMGQGSMTTPAGTIVRDIERTIVGVVADSRDLAGGAAPRPKVYQSYQQAPPSPQ